MKLIKIKVHKLARLIQNDCGHGIAAGTSRLCGHVTATHDVTLSVLFECTRSCLQVKQKHCKEYCKEYSRKVLNFRVFYELKDYLQAFQVGGLGFF